MTDGIGLDELIRQHQDRTGESFAQIATRAGLSKAKVGQLALKGGPHVPRAETLSKLATGLQVPFSTVQAAAMVTAGVAPESGARDQRVDVLAMNAGHLDDDDLERVEVFIEALIARRRRG